MHTWHIHISGRVQGVGFRPFVYRLAQSMQLSGSVQNGLDGVHIYVNASMDACEAFCQQLRTEAPPISHISALESCQVRWQEFQRFEIIASQESGQANLLITPDLALCDNCRQELHDPENRRYLYPFNSCTHCGPRYSILHSLPFDREHTSMHSFRMCSCCESEYQQIDSTSNAVDKRYHAQTNSCPTCGIAMQLYCLKAEEASPVRQLAEADQPTLLKEAGNLLKKGKIIAVKGIGGYLLMADATSAKVVQKLRQRKHRPAKPFALMYPSLEQARQDVEISEKEAAALLSYRAPIVLLRLKDHPASGIALQDIAPELSRMGIMLPYTPLFELILQDMGRPLIATSANISGSPIYYRDEAALSELQGIADDVLANNREICLPQDDSVLQFSSVHQQSILLRRSRGLAPAYLLPAQSGLANQSCLAMGAQQKSTFALTAHRQLYVSQHLGELSNYDTAQAYQSTLDYFLQLCKVRPEVILADQHPEYYATQLGKQWAEEKNIPIHYIQHHKAHFAAVLAENNLLESPEPILGVVWDGSGLGEDRHIWGGEFFILERNEMRRIAHLAYAPHRFGDKMAQEPRLSLLCLTEGDAAFHALLEAKFTPQEWRLYQKVLSKQALQKTSSMGRLFDAVASLLNICNHNQFESQSAILLEQQAASYLEKHNLCPEDGYTFSLEHRYTNHISASEAQADESFSIHQCLPEILLDVVSGKEPSEIAARFHLGLVNMVRAVAQSQQLQKISFSGGVFQNALLMDLLITHLSSDFALYFHQHLSPNDESLAFGQIAYHYLSQPLARQSTKRSLQPLTLNLYVPSHTR